ncbi:hypothetical protein [Saccharothrix algeriensis]|uniref:Uncharacterized protein n=1 Tax=Saccharothrix algeriensis TaxID=173560 RepID=A0A8T8I1R6_9PSEU|nr:hypothetical protein [Saccharothrix algeriensis]MBM7810619.1 hypothetical protein [Saccharothrix algeriensis]QTR04706.1 hypothetical protein J7S33_07710 [Saccharothrix algeriensis]
MTPHRRRARARLPRPDPVHVQELVEHLRADRSWRDEVARRLVARLDQRLVRSAKAGGCRPLAQVAEQLDSQPCVDLGPGAPHQLAKAVYEQVPLRGAARLRHTARSLRVLGVYLCGEDLARCPCAAALARDPRQASVDRVVPGALDGAGF